MILILLIGLYFYFVVKNQEIQAKRDLEAKKQWEEWDRESSTWEPELWEEPECEQIKKIKQWLKEAKND